MKSFVSSISLKSSKSAQFFGSFSPSSKAVILLSLPFTLIDAVHYYTAGTALVVSLPILALLYFACGMLAALFALNAHPDCGSARKAGFVSGIKLWAASTLINTLVSFFAGALSLGVTILLSIPYLLLCAPVHLFIGALVGLLGASVICFVYRRTMP